MAATVMKLDRMLLAIYLLALVGLLMSPFSGPGFRLLGIGADKWIHVALFGGLSVFLQWNLAAGRHAASISVGLAFTAAIAFEMGQSLVAYRSAELSDLVAGLVGAILGALIAKRIVSSNVPEKSIGLLVAALGIMIAALFILADMIGVSRNNVFGAVQMTGAALGILIFAGGVGVYKSGARDESRTM